MKHGGYEKKKQTYPYQELYLNAALNTSSTNLENVYYFIATIDGEFIGYQAALLTKNHLNLQYIANISYIYFGVISKHLAIR